MEVEFVLLPDDVIALHEYTLDHPTKQMGDVSRGIWIIVAFLAIMSGLSVPYFLRGEWSATTLFPVILLVAFLYWRLLWRRLARRRIRRDLAEGADKNSRELGWRRVVLTPEAITNTTERESCSLRWSAVEKIVVASERALIFNSPASAYIVPYRAFADEDAFREFVRTARAYRDTARQAPRERKGSRPRPAAEKDTNITPEEGAGR